MTILDEYNTTNRPDTLAKRIAFRVLDELLDRKGFNDLWGNIDHEIQNDILSSLIEIVEKELRDK